MPGSFRSRFLSVAVVVAILGVTAAVLASSPVQAATAASLHEISNQEDRFYNYDFNSGVASASNVDWAISLVFYNNAEIDKVKLALDPYLPYTQNGTKIGGVSDDGSAYQFDGDQGRKVTPCPPAGEWFPHYRVYADGDDQLYNTSYGYYVIGSTHGDYNDGCAGAQAGYSEWAEDWIAYWSHQVWPDRVHQDYGFLHNAEAFRVETSDNRPHVWDNDGYATYVNVP